MEKNVVLVTGGAGFIGTHLCHALIQAGKKVRVLDIADPKTVVDQVEYIKDSVCNQKAVRESMVGVSAVYHFAAIVSVPLCQESPLESYETNFMGVCRVLEEAKKNKTRVIFAGSSAVYGKTGDNEKPISEEAEGEGLPQPLSFYAAQKFAAEQAIRLFHQKTEIPTTVFRFFNVFGPGQDPSSPYSGVISLFDRYLREGRALPLNGGGKQTRDFVSVHDVVAANLLALDLPVEKANGSPINLGAGDSITIRKLAETMVQVSGKTVPIENAPAREGDVLHSRANIGRAKKILGWVPKVALAEGLAEVIS